MGFSHLFDHHVASIEEDAIRVRAPGKGEIVQAMHLPQIWQLTPGAVDHKRDFVELHELWVLRCLRISDEQPIFDFRRHVCPQTTTQRQHKPLYAALLFCAALTMVCA